jgi:hypothetical protein
MAVADASVPSIARRSIIDMAGTRRREPSWPEAFAGCDRHPIIEAGIGARSRQPVTQG